MDQAERRRHPRLASRLNVSVEGDKDTMGRTIDVAAGGVRWAGSGEAPRVGDALQMELTVPPGHGHWPTAGTVRGSGVVLRCEPAIADSDEQWAAAIRFDEPLELQFA